jgi:hypothetical protein
MIKINLTMIEIELSTIPDSQQEGDTHTSLLDEFRQKDQVNVRIHDLGNRLARVDEHCLPWSWRRCTTTPPAAHLDLTLGN